MPDETRVLLETQRLINLVRGFGWEKKEEKVDNEGITIVLRMELPSTAPKGPSF
jgi:hypothetical protein